MSATPRQALRELLATATETGPFELRELSSALHRSEREVADDLAHLERSLANEGAQLVIEPSQCLGCGFVFEGRRRFKRPGRCPKCRGTRLSYPRFSIA